MLRLSVVAVGVVVVAATLALSAHAALFFLFKPTAATSGDLVTVRLGETPSNFTLDQRVEPFQRPIRLYLVPNPSAGEISTRFDPRLHFIGRLISDRNSRGILTFTVPPLDTGTYVVAGWCPGCAEFSLGRTFFVLPMPRVSRYRDLMGLRVQLPSAKETCPATIPRNPEGWYGNGLLSTQLGRDGVLLARGDSDGTLFQKLGWLPRAGIDGAGTAGALTVRGERLDTPSSPMRVLGVYWGYASQGPYARGSWASAVRFPSEGCWRITGRVRDVTLSYVVKVVASA